MKPFLVAAALLAAIAIQAKPQTYLSHDRVWRLVITPREGERPRAELFLKIDGAWNHANTWDLVNEVAPVSALVADYGVVVTFDNVGRLGHGDDVVVIYRPPEVIRKYALTDLLVEADIARLRHNKGSIYWAGEHRINDNLQELILQVEAHKMEELPIRLHDGQLLFRKRPLFPQPEATWRAVDPGSSDCSGALALSAEELAKRVLSSKAPEYPDVAVRARVSGTVVLELAIDEEGKVADARLLRSMPYELDEAAQDAVRRWQFQPMQREGVPVPSCGHVEITYVLD